MEPPLSQLLLLTLLAASGLAVPRKDCRLVRSSSGGGQCFSEPECEERCEVVQERRCQTNTEQVWGRGISIILLTLYLGMHHGE